MNEWVKEMSKAKSQFEYQTIVLLFVRIDVSWQSRERDIENFYKPEKPPHSTPLYKYGHIKTVGKSQPLHCIWETSNNKTHNIDICKWLSVLLTMRILMNIIFYYIVLVSDIPRLPFLLKIKNQETDMAEQRIE